jgi:hypothetical protein
MLFLSYDNRIPVPLIFTDLQIEKKKKKNRKKPRYKDKKSNKRYCIVLQQIAAFQCQLYDVYLGTPT